MGVRRTQLILTERQGSDNTARTHICTGFHQMSGETEQMNGGAGQSSAKHVKNDTAGCIMLWP